MDSWLWIVSNPSFLVSQKICLAGAASWCRWGSWTEAAARGHWSRPSPGLQLHRGYPAKSNPFVQVHLPPSFRYEGKGSRAVSYLPEDGQMLSRGTVRTFQQALSCVVSWSWMWWNTLSSTEQSALRAMDSKPVGGCAPSKRRKVQ